MCVCVCVCVYLCSIYSLMHISLNNRVMFCPHIFVYVLYNCRIDFINVCMKMHTDIGICIYVCRMILWMEND